MDRDNDYLKDQYERVQEQVAAQSLAGELGRANRANTAPYIPPTLRERLNKATQNFQQESRLQSHREELLYLLDKNPDVARILELLELVQV